MITEVTSINNDKDIRVVVDVQVCAAAAPAPHQFIQLMRNSES
jgi:hypothetical protein